MVFQKSINISRLLWLIALCIWGFSIVSAQSTGLLLHVCVTPDNGTPAYLITFRDTDLENNTMGMALPDSAQIVVYGTETSNGRFGIFNLAPDAETGGYQLAGEITTGLTRVDIPRTNACVEEYPEIITEDIPTSSPQQFAPGQGIFLEFISTISDSNETSVIPPTSILGAFSLHFRPSLGGFSQDIQLIQTSPGGIEVSFPGILSETTRFVAIGNKDFGVQISFAEFLNRPLQPIPANPRVNFIELLERQRFPIDGEIPLDLFILMAEGGVRFYPFGGVVYEYPAQGFIRFDTSPIQSEREVSFIANNGETITVIPIVGATPGYDAIENESTQYMGVEDRAQVVEVRDGVLIVTSSRMGLEATVDAWLVTIATEDNE